MFAQQGAQLADDPGHVPVAGEQHVAAGDHVHRELIDAGNAQLTFGEHRPGDAVAGLGAAGAQLQGASGEIAAGVVLDLQHVDTPLLGLKAGIDVVDAVPKGCGEQTLEGRHHQRLGRVHGEITLEADLQLADRAASQLADQLAEDFGQLQVGLELLHHLGIEAGDVDRTAGGQAQQHIADLLGHVDGHILLGLFGGGAEVGSEDQPLLDRSQGRAGLKGLLGVHVKGRAADGAIFNRRGQGCLVNDASTGTVDDAGRRFHRLQQLRVYQVLGVGGAGQVQADVIGLGKQGRQGQQPHLHLLGPFGRHIGVVGHHIHAHGLAHPGHVGADLAQTNHAKLLLVELVTDVFLAVPAAGHGAGVGVGHMARKCQHQGQGLLSGGDGVALRRVHHQHTPLGGGRHVHVVHPDTGAANDPQFVGRFNDFGGHRGAGADHQGFVVADDRPELLRWKACAHIHLGHLGKDVNPRLVDRIRNENLCHAQRWGG